jgi:hypothetical protein
MDYVAVLLPPVLVGLIFWFAIRAIFNADKSEREAFARAEREAQGNDEGKSSPKAE